MKLYLYIIIRAIGTQVMFKNGNCFTINHIESECQPLLTSLIKSGNIKTFNGNTFAEWKSGNERVLEYENVCGLGGGK